ncbi:MAG: hypothetical protein ACOCUJ_02350 [Thiohalospira sp.]|uniref:hypothetical protein n=1 Tax=Thiohalorhabdus sp. TaxID=3094134 RepID=UPI003980D0C8
MQRILATLVLGASLLLAYPTESKAASYVAQDVWYSTLYGAAIGGVTGTGVMLLTDDPLGNTDYIVTGVGIGIISGMVYGIYSYAISPSYGALANVDPSGTTHYAVPMPEPYINRFGGGQEVDVGVRMDLIRARF